MAIGNTIHTWFKGSWHAGNTPILGAADHATWLGTLVFDGARRFEGRTPDLDRHCARVDHSALALGLRPTLTVETMHSLCIEGLTRFAPAEAVYIRPMYWSVEGAGNAVLADPESTEFALCLESVPMPAATATQTLAITRFTRPTLSCATVDAKAACLYPNNARMLREAGARGFSNALACDGLGNVAETATANIFMVRDGEYFTPVPNGTFLNGITRQRIVSLLRNDGHVVHEVTLSIDDFRGADEVFMSGNMSKVSPVVALEDKRFEVGPSTRRVRELYWDWSHGN